jgi:hypothetical protein
MAFFLSEPWQIATVVRSRIVTLNESEGSLPEKVLHRITTSVWPWGHPKKLVRCGLQLSCDHFIGKECINLRRKVPIAFDAHHPV